MKQPLQALLLADEDQMWALTLNGDKRITIRTDHRDYRVGESMLLVSASQDRGCWADITSVRHCLFRELTEEELNDDGFADMAQALREMSRFYPDISEDSAVTVIRWDNVRGKMVDIFREWLAKQDLEDD